MKTRFFVRFTGGGWTVFYKHGLINTHYAADPQIPGTLNGCEWYTRRIAEGVAEELRKGEEPIGWQILRGRAPE